MDQTIRLDAKKRESSFCEEKIYPLRRGERNNVVLTVQVRADGAPYDLTGKEARLVGTAADGKLVGPCALEVSDAKAGTGSLTLPASMCSAVGTTHAYIEIREGDTLVETTDSFACKVLECADMDAEQAEEYRPLLVEVEVAVADAKKATDAATKAATDAQAAITEVKATEAKLYPVAENTLKGTAKDTFVHIDDAFPSKLLAVTVEGACKQDGTPSPDNPVPIQVVENPVLQVRGRNLCQGFEYGQIDTSGNEINSSTTTSCRTGFINVAGGSVYVLSLSGVANSTTAKGRQYDSAKSHLGNISLSGKGATLDSRCAFIRYEFDESVKGDAKKLVEGSAHAQIEQGSSPTAYAPYTSQSLAFTLPQEHPYLAKLPDGTADEITVDEEGNVELVARVAKVLPSELVRYAADDAAGGASYAGIVFANTSQTKGRVLCSAYQPTTGSAQSGTIYCPNQTTIIVRDSRFTSKEKAIELLNGVVVYVAVEETRYQLGKIDMPKAQDSIVNVWIDAEVTPNTGIEYVRDVNIVIANLESAIASIS
mgnify:CR=1 FL=1